MLMKTKGPFVKETLRAELLLCGELAAERKKGAHKALAESNDWPLTIDFKSLPDRIIDLKVDIDSVIKNGIAKDDPIRVGLLHCVSRAGLGPDFSKLARMPFAPMEVFEASRPG